MSTHDLKVRINDSHRSMQVRMAIAVLLVFLAGLVGTCVIFLTIPESQGFVFYDIHQNTCDAYSVAPNTIKLTDWLPYGIGRGGSYHARPDSDANSGLWRNKRTVRIQYDIEITLSRGGRTIFRWNSAPVLVLNRRADCPS
jgi:hypothetical protein